MKKSVKLLLCRIIMITLIAAGAILPAQNTAFAAALKINKSKLTLKIGKSYTLKIKGTAKTIKWKSSNKKIASVSSKGKVTAKSEGTAAITATIGKQQLKCRVTVKDYEVKVVFSALLQDNMTIDQYIRNVKKESPDFIAVEKYDDEHYTAVMKESTRIKLARDTADQIDKAVEKYKSGSDYSELFSDIKYDKLLTKVTIYAYRNKCSSFNFVSVVVPITYISDYVQAVNLVDVKDRSCTIAILDNKTNQILYESK